MKKYVLVVLLVIIALLSCSDVKKKTVLWNGRDFSGWTRFIPGDSVDVNTVWTVENGLLHCSGKPTGYMRTNESFSNYKLHVEWRWVNEGGNSGVLLHCQGPDQVWPRCIECQLKADNAGDVVLIGPGEITVAGKAYKNEAVYLIIPKRQTGNEKPLGQWNSYDIICQDHTVACSVNGVEQNRGEKALFSTGPIALQSEGAAIEFRQIVLEQL